MPSTSTLLTTGLALLATPLAQTLSAETLLVKNAIFITMAPDEDPFVGYMTVDDEGKIAAIAPGEAPEDLTVDTIIDAEGKIVAPGFISAHSHLFTSGYRGLGHTETLYGWGAAIGRLGKHASAEDMYWFTLHGSLDFLRNGVTTAYDFTNAPKIGGQAVGVGEVVPPAVLKDGPYEENQIRAKIDANLRFINSIGMPGVGTKDEIIARYDKVYHFAHDTYGDNPLFLGMAISGGQQRAPTKDTAYLEAEVMQRYDVLNQAHFLESPERVTEQQAKFWWYLESGALSPKFIFGHFIQTTPEIVAAAAKAGANMSWQPTSNSRLASGIAAINQYRAFGMKIAIGLDDQSCTDLSDPFQNLRIGMALMRTKYKDATALSIYDMLYFHTLGSAEVLHIDDKVGSLEPGKFADFLIVDPENPDTGPIHEAFATYVLACGLPNLKQVYVGGKLVADGITLVGQDEAQINSEVHTRVARLSALADAAETAANH